MQTTLFQKDAIQETRHIEEKVIEMSLPFLIFCLACYAIGLITIIANLQDIMLFFDGLF